MNGKSAIDWVRERPQQFFGNEEPDPLTLLSYITADVLALGRGECRVRQQDGYWFVSSDRDWMVHSSFRSEELFVRVVTAPQHGVHSMRSEIIVNAFAQDVMTRAGSVETQISGRAVDRALLEASVDLEWAARVLVFRM